MRVMVNGQIQSTTSMMYGAVHVWTGRPIDDDCECYRWWPERRWCKNTTSSSSPSAVGLASLNLGNLGGLFIALAVTLVATTAVSVAQWFWWQRSVPVERRNKPSTGNRLPLSQLRQTVR